MKYLKFFTLFIFFFVFAGTLNAQPDQMQIRVDADLGFQKRTFDNGAELFSNRNYVAENIPEAFRGFEFLASDGKVVNTGTIIPTANGLIYMIAPSGGLNGWTLVENSEFNYSDTNKTKLSIYSKSVVMNEEVPIPEVTHFAGASPLAKSITLTNHLFVKGHLIDIMSFIPGQNVFPQNTTFKIPASPPSYLSGKKYAVSLIENPGPSKVKSSKSMEIYAAVHHNNVFMSGWTNTGDVFTISSVRKYYVYKYQYTVPGEWIDVPQPSAIGTKAPTLIFCDSINWVDYQPLPGTVITKSIDPKNVFISNPTLVVLPTGEYLAACAGAFRDITETHKAMSFFISADGGQTWSPQARNTIKMSYASLFIHNNELYMMGVRTSYGNVAIRKSGDKGKTWTEPTNASNGLLRQDGYFHSAPVPIAIHNGRIWRAMENATNTSGSLKRTFVMSAPVNADLMKAENWTSSNELDYNIDWITGGGRSFKQWLEGNVVVDKTGNLVNILRVDEETQGGVAAMVRVNSPTNISFDPVQDIIQFPGGGKKFTIRHDAVTNKYWTLSNAEFDEDRGKTHSGIYKNGVHCGLLRNRLVLMYSDNLRNWVVKDTLISSDNPFFHGFQYLDWQFDGNDIIAVSRTAFEDMHGQAARQHDANYLLFHRFTDFREGLDYYTDLNDVSSEKPQIYLQNSTLHISFLEHSESFDIFVYDTLGSIIYSQTNALQTGIDTSNWKAGVYVVRVKCGEKVVVKKISIKGI